jgi:hypothetical protein
MAISIWREPERVLLEMTPGRSVDVLSTLEGVQIFFSEIFAGLSMGERVSWYSVSSYVGQFYVFLFWIG